MLSHDPGGLRRLQWILRTLLSHYRHHPGQAITMAVGLVTGVALWAAVQLINDQARTSYAEADQLLGAATRFWIRPAQGDAIDVNDYIELRRAGFTQLYPIIETRVRSQAGDRLTIIATDLLAVPDNSGPPAQSGDDSSADFGGTGWLTLIQPPYRAWYSPDLAEKLRLQPDEQLRLADGTLLPPAVIVSRPEQGEKIFMDLGAAIDVLQRSGVSYLAVGQISPKEQQRLQSQLPAHLRLVANTQALDLAQLTRSLHTNLTALGLLAFTVGLFIVFNTVRFSLLARQATLTVLREMGASAASLSVAIGIESVLWSLFGTGLGLVLGHGLGQLLLPGVAASLQSLYDASINPQLALQPLQVLLALGLTLAGMVLALALPLWNLAGQTLRSQRDPNHQWRASQRSSWQMAALALPLLATAGLLYGHIATVEAGFIMLALVLLAGALLLPAVILMITATLERLLPERLWRLRWAVSDARAQLPHLRIALMALLLALTANLGVTLLIDSFRGALTDWLETRLSATVYIQSESLDTNLLVASEHVTALHERMGVTLRWGERPSTILGLSPAAPDTRRMALTKSNANTLQRWVDNDERPAPIIANEQVRFLGGRELGDIITLPTPRGPADFTLIGFAHDYGNPGFAFYLPRDTLLQYWPNAASRGVAVWLTNQDTQVIDNLLTRAGADPGEWLLQDTIRAMSLAVFDRTFAITAALNTLTLLVAGVALLAALLAIHQLRLPSYSHWHSMGVSRGEWLGIVGLPLLVMTLVTLALALPLGLTLSWLLISKLNVLAFGWTMPLVWQWTPVAKLALLTAITLSVSLLLIQWRMTRTLPAALKQLGVHAS